MRVLFVCRGNVSRSQMAAAIYNKLSNSQSADSAGTHVDNPGESLFDRSVRFGGSLTLDVRKDHGYVIDKSLQTQLTPEMLNKYDKVISMAGIRYTPKWLANAPNYVYWKITDPKGRSYKITDTARKAVEAKIKALLFI